MEKDKQLNTLNEIRRAISDNDALRLDPDIPEEDRKMLETVALTLRDMEREMLSETAEGLLDRMEAAAGQAVKSSGVHKESLVIRYGLFKRGRKMVMRRRVPVLAVYFLVPVLIACSDNAQVQWNPCAVVDSLVSAGQYDRAVGVARTQYDSARLSGDRRVAVGLGARLGRLYYMNFSPDSMYYYFDDVTQDAEELEMYQECIIIHNIIGVFSLINAIEYENALHHFYAAMDYAEKSDNTDAYYKLLTNVAIIHYIRKDPAGLAAAGEIYDYGSRTGDSYFMYAGALMYAYMHHSLGNDAEALGYIREAGQWPEYSVGSDSYEPLYASVLASLGRDDEAERVFLHCLETHRNVDSTIQVEALAGYGKFLAGKGRYGEAVAYYTRGLEITEKYQLYFYGYGIYQELAEVYTAMGEYDLAMEYLTMYYSLKDKVFNVERERSFNSLIRRYESQKNANELQRRDMQLLKQRQLTELVIAAFVVALVVVLAVVLRNRSQNMMYRQLVVKYNAYQKREKELLERLDAVKQDGLGGENGTIRLLFDRLSDFMRQEKMYAVKNLTVEDMAARLGTNRSYLSRAVNTYAGVSFNAWLNSMRIKESIKLLSETDMPIKKVADEVGYANLTTFYNNFIKETGVPPSKFRTESKGRF